MRRLARLFAETIIAYRNQDVSSGDQIRPSDLFVNVDELLKAKPAEVDALHYIRRQLPFTDKYAVLQNESVTTFVDRAIYLTLKGLTEEILAKHSHRKPHVSLLLRVYDLLTKLNNSCYEESKSLCDYRSQGNVKRYVQFLQESILNRNESLAKDLKQVLSELYRINRYNESKSVLFNGQTSELAPTCVYRFGVYTGVSDLGKCLREQLLRPLKLSGELSNETLAEMIDTQVNPEFRQALDNLRTQEQLQWARDYKSEATGEYADDEKWQLAVVEEKKRITSTKALIDRLGQHAPEDDASAPSRHADFSLY